MKMKYVLHGIKNLATDLRGGQGRHVARTTLNYASAIFRTASVPAKPSEIQIEPSSKCNLDCRMCNINKDIETAILTPERFERWLTELVPLRSLNLTGLGESLMNKNISTLIRMARERGIRTALISNGLLLTEFRIRGLVESGLNSISISIESADPRTYETIREGGSFQLLLNNLKLLGDAARCNHFQPEVLLNVVLLKQNLEQPDNIFQIIDLAAECWIRKITFQNVNDTALYGTADWFSARKPELEALFERIRQYAASRNVEVCLPSCDIRPGSCYYPWVYPYITAFGDVLPCCVLPQFGKYPEASLKYSFGNINQTPFADIWNGAQARSFREQLASRQPVEYCQRCSKYQNIL
jgi:radical SAM protein with 4Fe4S-binding SPASM domain